MPDTQIDTSTAPLPLPSGGAPSLGDMTSDKFDKIVGQEADLYKRKIGAEGAAQAQYDALHKQARSRMEGLINQEAASVEDLKPWDVNKELEKTKTSLWDQFGSPGFIISMIGSAFSAMPMNTAFEAGAAAMNAQHQGKMDAYNKAFDAWKANTDLTMKRLDIEQSEFADVDKLWTTDREAWKQRMESTLLRFNDQRKLLLLRNGMDQELMDSIAAQQKARQQIGIASQGIMENDLRRQLTQADPDWPIGPDGKPKQGEDGKPMRPDPQKMAGVVQRVEDRMRGIEGKPLTPEQEFILKFNQEHPFASSEELTKAIGEFRKAEYPYRLGGAQAQNAKAKEEVAADVRKEHPDWTSGQVDLEAAKRIKQATAPPMTGNERAKLEGHLEQYNEALLTIDKVTDVLDRYVGAAGIAGRATRAQEIVGNIFGSNETARKQMARDIELLQLMAPRLLLDATGRPLSSEAGHVLSIVAGLNMGDTTENTLRAYQELKDRLQRLRGSVSQRLDTGGTGTKAPAETSTPQKSGSWDEFPKQ